MSIKQMLRSKDAVIPDSGFNLVGVDEYDQEAPLFVVSHHTSKSDADTARRVYEKENPGTKTEIFSKTDR